MSSVCNWDVPSYLYFRQDFGVISKGKPVTNLTSKL